MSPEIKTTTSPTLTPTTSPLPSPTQTITPSPTKTLPRQLIFYGDSSLAIGDAGDNIDHVGFSFVTNLARMIDPTINLITVNFGGRTAKWAYENLSTNVLSLEPDIVTLWWGGDDMRGCPGSFDPITNILIIQKAETLVNEHIYYMDLLISAILDADAAVIVMTPIPANGLLPWSYLDEDNSLVWDYSRWCNFNGALELLVNAQRRLVQNLSSENKAVFLVDVWQIYLDHAGTEKMYMDIVHPASAGAELIAEGWNQVFQESQK